MTVHDRREATLACLASLARQEDVDAEIRVVLVDDGSTDGTAEAVRQGFPEVEIIPADGTLFWAAGMALAEQRAMALLPDLLLWLNDDVILDPDALAQLLAVHRDHPAAIVAGTLRDPVSGATTYGPRRRLDAHPQRFALMPAGEQLREIDAFNGNVVLVPRSAHALVGPLDGAFAHAYADDDYSLRARACGVAVLNPPGTLGACERHDRGPVRATSWAAAWQQLQHPARRPWSSQVRYLRRHAGWRWPLYLTAGYTKALVGARFGRGRDGSVLRDP